MKKLISKILLFLSMLTVLVYGGAIGVNAAVIHAPIKANESHASVIIFGIIIAVLAAAGIVYFIIQNKNNKK